LVNDEKGTVMILLYRGRCAPAVRAAVGVALLILGHFANHGAVFGLVGAALVAWGLVGAISARCARDQRVDVR